MYDIVADLLRNSKSTIFSMLLFIVTFVVGCKTESVMSESEYGKVLEITDNSKIICDLNELGTYKLCKNDVDVNDPLKPDYLQRFIIIDNSSEEILYKNSINGGYVKWMDNDRIEFYSAPGIIKDGETKDDYVKIYNIKLKLLQTKSAFLRKDKK